VNEGCITKYLRADMSIYYTFIRRKASSTVWLTIQARGYAEGRDLRIVISFLAKQIVDGD